MTKKQAITLALSKAKQHPEKEYLVYMDISDYDDTWEYFVCTSNCLPYYTRDSEIVFSTWE